MLYPEKQIEGGALWWQRRWAQWGLIFGIWTLIGLVFTSQLYFATIRSERPYPWVDAFVQQFTYSYLWALATPLVIWLAERYPIEGQLWLRNLLRHMLFSVVLIFILGSLHHIIYYLYFARPLGKPYLIINTLRNVVYNTSENFGIYGLIALIRHLLSYYNRYRKGEVKASQLEAQLSQAQLQALKMQLHPHFLFNTLHSISALLHKDVEAADKMIARLGDFLRITLENSGHQKVTLEQELNFLRGYLEIESIRFQDRLSTQIDVDPQALGAQVPNLILQPIVENAIRHGIATSSTPGRIEIYAERKNGLLRIQVRDNGPGLQMNRSFDKTSKEGLGLANTRARLNQLYGVAHRFEMANDPQGGLVVILEIPSGIDLLQRQEREQDADAWYVANSGVSR